MFVSQNSSVLDDVNTFFMIFDYEPVYKQHKVHNEKAGSIISQEHCSNVSTLRILIKIFLFQRRWKCKS